jgi:hypothetical protein
MNWPASSEVRVEGRSSSTLQWQGSAISEADVPPDAGDGGRAFGPPAAEEVRHLR